MPNKTTILTLAALSLAACDTFPTRRGTTDGRQLALSDGGARQNDFGINPGHDQGAKPKIDTWQSSPDLGGAPPPPPPPPFPDSGTPPPIPDAGPGPGDYDFLSKIKFHQVASLGKSCNPGQYGAFYCDVMDHTITPYLSGDTMTVIHETQHFMAHDYDGITPEADKFIYYKNGKGAFFPEPQLKTQGIVSSIKHQGTTYNTYIANRPTQSLGENIVDEWRAYLTEEIVAIQISQIKKQSPGSISGLVLGGVEYLYYNAAMLHALQTKEPTFLQQNPQAVAVFAMMAEETKKWTIDQGLVPGLFFSLTNQKGLALLNDLRTGAQNAHIRATLKSLYGPKWTLRVLGFQ